MDLSRRRVMKGLMAVAALTRAPVAGALPELSPGDPDARALDFVPDVAAIDPSRRPDYRPGSRCAGCYFYQGRSGSASAPCTVFAGWRVPATGWCREFVAR